MPAHVSVIAISVEKFMLEGILVPDAILIEYEDLLRAGISEDQVLIKHIDAPEQLSIDFISVQLLQVGNVHIVLFD